MELLADKLFETFNTENATMMVIFFDTSTSSDFTMDAIREIRALAGEQCFVSGMSALVTDLKNLCEEDGDRTVVAGLAFPGLQDMNHDMLELLSYVEITADVQGFALETTVTMATNGLFDDIVGETDGSFDGLDDFRGILISLRTP